jgi:hypothetical protein
MRPDEMVVKEKLDKTIAEVIHTIDSVSVDKEGHLTGLIYFVSKLLHDGVLTKKRPPVNRIY